MKIFHLTTLILLSLIVVSCKTTENAGGSYSWPNFQSGLRPGLSTSPLKAEFSGEVVLTSAEPGTPEEYAAYGGIWEGWMCRDAIVDAKVAISNITATGASINYASAAETWRSIYAGGVFNRSTSASFEGDTLQGTLAKGVNLILGMRPDGHLNVKWEQYTKGNWCTGILKKTKSPA